MRLGKIKFGVAAVVDRPETINSILRLPASRVLRASFFIREVCGLGEKTSVDAVKLARYQYSVQLLVTKTAGPVAKAEQNRRLVSNSFIYKCLELALGQCAHLGCMHLAILEYH